MTRYYLVGGTHGSHPVAYSEHNAAAVEHGRPVVVIDPEDDEGAEGLLTVLATSGAFTGVAQGAVGKLQAALREFADPQPAKPPEPTGFLAIVRDHAGNEWINYRKSWTTVHHETPWVMADDSEEFADYADIAAAEVLFEGVTP